MIRKPIITISSDHTIEYILKKHQGIKKECVVVTCWYGVDVSWIDTSHITRQTHSVN